MTVRRRRSPTAETSKACRQDMTFTQGTTLFKAMLRVFPFVVLLGTVSATGGDEVVVGGFAVDAHNSWWTLCGIGVLALEFLVGVLWWICTRDYFGVRRNEHMPVFVAAWTGVIAHGAAQFLPLIAILSPGLVDCGTGLWWPVHWLYTFVLLLAMPVLSGSGKGSHQAASIPILGCKGSYLAQAYFYVTSVLGSSDQYLDCMSAAVALQCEWRLAWVMVSIIVVSITLQALAAAIVNGHAKWGVWSFVGFAPEAIALAGQVDLREQQKEMMSNPLRCKMDPNWKGKEWRTEESLIAEDNGLKFAASQAVAKLVTENVPQAYLAIKFAYEVKPSKMIEFSAAMSLALAFKAFIGGLSYLCSDHPIEVEMVKVEEGEEEDEEEYEEADSEAEE